MRKVLVIDTSVLCVWLKVPGKETCGPSNALVTYWKETKIYLNSVKSSEVDDANAKILAAL